MKNLKRRIVILIIIFFILSNCITKLTYATEEMEKIEDNQTVTSQATVGTKYQVKDEETWDISKNGKKNVIAKWTLKDKTLRISGKGEMKDWWSNETTDIFDYKSNNDWHKAQYLINVENVIIENGITNIGHYAFYKCINLKKVTIPESIELIGTNVVGGDIECVFYRCKSLREIQVDSNNKKFTSIDGVLYNKAKTVIIKYPPKKESTKYTIPNTVKKIEEYAFEYGGNLTSIVIPNSVTNIEEYAFYENSSLKNVEIPTSVKNIKQHTFYGCSNLSNIIIPNTVTNIGENAFNNCSNLKSIKIPNSVNTIRRGTFRYCSSLTSVTIPNSVTSIQSYAFSNCSSLKSIKIPESVVTIGLSCFEYCTNLKSVTFPNSLKKIQEDAFDLCENLVNINIPNNVTSIGKNAFSICEGPIICKTNSIAHKYAESEGIEYRLLDSVKSKYGTKHQLKDKEEIDISFYLDRSIVAVFTWKNKTLRITGNEKNVVYGKNNNHQILDLANKYIPYVETLSIENKEFDIDWLDYPNMFINLKNIKVSNGHKYYKEEKGVLFNKEKTKLILYPCKKNQISYTIPSGVKSICNNAFYNCIYLKSIKIPESVVTIGSGSFKYCINLKSVKIPNSVKTISEGAFKNCSGLKNVEISNGIKTIKYATFRDCGSLTNIKIPNSVTKIEEEAFSGCSNLIDIEIPNSVTNIGNGSFAGCSSLNSITIPQSVKTIGQEAFNYCTNLENLTLSNGVKTIKEGAFQYCLFSSNIIIPNSVTKIEGNAFDYESILICKVNSVAHKYAENEGIGYILDEEGPVATFNPQTFTTPKKSTSVKVTVSDVKSKVVSSSLKYLWSKKTTVNSEEIKTSFKSGDTISSPKNVTGKYYLYIYAEDVLGNKKITKSKEINLDNTAPKVTVKYSTTKKTNKDVTITVTANEQIQTVSGWVLSKDKKVLTKTYKTNGTEKITIKDLAGNTTTQTIKVANIDKTAPKVTVKYSITKATNQNVIVTITANEEIQSVSGWTFSKDKKVLTKTYKTNGTEKITIKDVVGNSTSQTIKIANIDKTAPKVTIKYSKTTKTNQDVVVTITANEEVQAVKGWSLSKDSKALTKTYTKNLAETIEVKDKVGNVTKKEIKIANIDKVAPTVKVTYSTKEPTNNSVKVTITSNEQIKQITGWSISKDGKILSKTYTKNTNEKIEVNDIAGNKQEQEIKITNIDKTAPKATVKYSKTTKTNQDVVVTITANEEVQGISGWNISNDLKTLTKTYTNNAIETIEIKDKAGNLTKKEIVIANIDKEAPIVNVVYSTTELTNNSVKVTIVSNEQIKQIEGWSISTDGKTLNKIYTKNKNENIALYDIAGNETKVNIKIENIDKTAIEAEIEYSKTELTNENVEVTVKANKELLNIEGWTISEDKLELKKTYTENKTEEILLKDIYGNERKVTIEVTNIDKEAPKLTIKQSEQKVTSQPIIVTIEADELIREIDGWELEENGKTLTKKYEENTKENVEVYDIAGNKESIEVNITNIDKSSLNIEVEQSTTKLTNKNVIVTITGNREIQEINGWKRSENKQSISKEYAENTEETIEIKDLIGNKTNVQVSITNIDKIAPKLTVNQSEKNVTTKPISVTISSDELIQEVEGWELGEDGKTLTKIYKQNTKEDIEVYDLAGNKQIVNINIQNIQEKEDEEGLDIDIKNSTTEMTNKDVEVEIIANKELQKVEGWTLSQDKKSLKRKYIKNTKETITVKDTSGNEEKVEIEIENIDKEAPKLTVNQSEKNVTTKPIVVTISSDELIQEVEGWNLEEDGKTLTKEYKENTKENVTIKDLAGNEIIQEIKIENIEEEKKEEEQEEQEKAKGDINQNSQIDIGDIVILLRNIAQENSSNVKKENPSWILSDEQKQIGDVNKNNKIDIGDIIKILRFIAATNSEEIATGNPEWLEL